MVHWTFSHMKGPSLLRWCSVPSWPLARYQPTKLDQFLWLVYAWCIFAHHFLFVFLYPFILDVSLVFYLSNVVGFCLLDPFDRFFFWSVINSCSLFVYCNYWYIAANIHDLVCFIFFLLVLLIFLSLHAVFWIGFKEFYPASLAHFYILLAVVLLVVL